MRSILKRTIPSPVRRLGWRGYYHLRNNWLRTIIGCRTTRKIVALTFDDGPNPTYTPPVLEILAHHQVKATFFLLGRNVATHPGTARQIAQAGHAVGNHTFTHPRLDHCRPMKVVRELSQCQGAIREAVGIAPKVMRPPFGLQDAKSYLITRMMGYAAVNWSVSGEDWQGDPASTLAARILADIQPGSIILLHDGWEPPPSQLEWRPEYDRFQDRSPTIEALPMIIESLQSHGYQFVTVPEMLRMDWPIRRG